MFRHVYWYKSNKKDRDYINMIWEYKVLSIKQLFLGNIIWVEGDRKNLGNV